MYSATAANLGANSFLTVLFGHALGPGLGLCVRTLRHGVEDPTQYRYSDVATLLGDAALTERNLDGASVYFGTAIRDLAHEAWSKKAGCVAITSLWADFDAKDFIKPADKKRATVEERELGKAQILRVLSQRLPAVLQPSIIVDTGGGYQMYWLLQESAPMQSGAAAFYEGLLAGLQGTLGADPSRKDITSIMRLPGTLNCKYEDRPLCHVIQLDPNRRFSPDNFENYRLPAEAPAAAESGMRKVDAGQDWDALLDVVKESEHYLETRGPMHLVTCPWEDEHSIYSGPTETALFTPSSDNEWAGGFKCHHAHCVDRSIRDVYQFFGLQTSAGGKAGTGGGTLLSVRQVLERLGRQQDWVVDRLLAVGSLSEIAGKPGAGKSLMAQEITWSVATGNPFLGRAVQQGLVVYFAFEGAKATALRFDELGLLDHENVRMWIYDCDGDPIPWLNNTLGDREPTLIVLDCLQDFIRTKESNSYSETVNALSPILQWAQNRKIHVLALHHSGKNEKAGIDAAIGSQGFSAKPETFLVYSKLDPCSKDPLAPRVLSCAKHRPSPLGTEDVPEVVLALDPVTRRLRMEGTRERIEQREDGKKILSVVASHDAGTSRRVLEEESGMRRASFLSALNSLVDAGALQRSGRGKRGDSFVYSAAPGGDEIWAKKFEADQVGSAFVPPAHPERAPSPPISTAVSPPEKACPAIQKGSSGGVGT
jgi:hypothetical protein